jgi:hypothetical protein
MSTSWGSNIIKDNLILWLDAASSKSYPGSGTTWHDLTTNNYDFTLVNSPTFDLSNKTFNFDGSNDYATIDLNLVFSGATFSAWFKTSETSAHISLLNKGGLTANPNINNGIAIASPTWATSSLQVYLNDSTGTTRTHLNGSINKNIRDNKWHNIAVTYNYDGSTSTLKSYLDGVLETTHSFAEDRTNFFNYTAAFNISRTILPWNGQISQFCLYNKTLSAEEVKQNYYAIVNRHRRLT